MKKILTTIFILLLLTLPFSGCSEKQNTISIEPTTAPDYIDDNGMGYNEKDDGSLELKTTVGTKKVEIPSQFKGKKITSVGRSAFKMKKVVSVTLPDTVTEIADYAFSFCTELTEINIPEGVEKIGDNAFSGCVKLKKIELPSSLKIIGMFAFDATAVPEITIPKNVETVGSYAFGQCEKLSKITVQGKNTAFSENAVESGKNIKIIGQKGSKAEEFAKSAALSFEIIS